MVRAGPKVLKALLVVALATPTAYQVMMKIPEPRTGKDVQAVQREMGAREAMEAMEAMVVKEVPVARAAPAVMEVLNLPGALALSLFPLHPP